MNTSFNMLAISAKTGNKDALEALVRAIQLPVYNIARRMLQNPTDAEDATQEILIKIVTHLGQFRGESLFSTWMYRVATNHLLNQSRRNQDKQQLSFEALSQHIRHGVALASEGPEELYVQDELIEETRRSCTMGMLQCLNPHERMAIILGELLEVNSDEAAAILEISSAAYRKRLSRARQQLVSFVSGNCGIVNPANPCRCHRLAEVKRQVGLLDANALQYEQAHDASSSQALLQAHNPDLDMDCRSIELLRTHPSYTTQSDLAKLIDRIVSAQQQSA